MSAIRDVMICYGSREVGVARVAVAVALVEGCAFGIEEDVPFESKLLLELGESCILRFEDNPLAGLCVSLADCSGARNGRTVSAFSASSGAAS